ncbi:NMD3-related protein [Acidilobus saccharovorans]|nr:NMD3-related protein [Acidilobus saccharovorans]
MPERICPMCGRSSREVEFIGSLCKDCFVKRYGIARLPEQVEVTYCTSCHAHRTSGRWSDPYPSLEESLTDYLEAYLANKVKPVEPLESVGIDGVRLELQGGTATAYVDLEGSYGDVKVKGTAVVKVMLKPTLCPVCSSRKTGEGYTAVVQLRSYPRSISEVRRLSERVQRIVASIGDDIVKVEERKEGLDVYVREHSAARVLATRLRSEFNAKVIETYKGRGDRLKLYVSVRLATVSPGDVLEVDGTPYFYMGDSQNGLLLINLETGKRAVMTPDELWDQGFKLYEGQNLERMMLLSRQGNRYVLVGDEGSIEVPSDQVEAFTESVNEGDHFLVYLSRRRIYLVRREE